MSEPSHTRVCHLQSECSRDSSVTVFESNSDSDSAEPSPLQSVPDRPCDSESASKSSDPPPMQSVREADSDSDDDGQPSCQCGFFLPVELDCDGQLSCCQCGLRLPLTDFNRTPSLQPVQSSDSDEPISLVTSGSESGYDGQSESGHSDILLPETDFDSIPESAANTEPESHSDSSEPHSDSDSHSHSDGQQLSCQYCLFSMAIRGSNLPIFNCDSTPEYVGDDKPNTYPDSDSSGPPALISASDGSDSDGPPPLQPVPPSDYSDCDSMPRLVTNSECGSESSYDGQSSSQSDFDTIPGSVDDNSSWSDDSTRIRQRIRQRIHQLISQF